MIALRRRLGTSNCTRERREKERARGREGGREGEREGGREEGREGGSEPANVEKPKYISRV
jgi:hypothetical protein